MTTNYLKHVLKAAVCAAGVLLAGAGIADAQSVNLTAAPSTVSLPDGSAVPMWGYTCNGASGGAACAAANPHANGGWSPVVITATTGSNLTINLTNNLTFANSNSVPTSIMIVGQLGGGLGDVTQRTTTPSPVHNTQNDATWSTVAPAAQPFTPPAQGPRVQSFGTEVAPAGALGSANQCASPCQLTWNNLRPGTYLLESGTHPSIQASMGLYGVLVVTNAPGASGGTETSSGTAYPNVSYDAEVPLVLGEIDPVQNTAVSAAVNTAGFSGTAVWSGQPGGCGNPSSPTYHTCYPPVVNYTPLYYLINGVAFSRTNSPASLFPVSPANTLTGGNQTVLVRLVNAGSRMHVPTIVGSQTTIPVAANATSGAAATTRTTTGFSLVAKDGNPAPGIPHVQSDVFMAAGKTFDVMINVPAGGGKALAVYDRELSLSANKINHDAGMLAYVSVNGSALPPAANGAPVANANTYNSLVSGQAFTVSDPGKGVIANDLNVYGVSLKTQAGNGTVVLNADGTFTYTPSGNLTSDSFVYEANGNPAITATVTLGPAVLETTSNISVPNSTFNSQVATYFKIGPPGVLTGATDTAGYPLSVDLSSVSNVCASTPVAPCVIPDGKGGFEVLSSGAGSFSFTFQAQNAQGVHSGTATATVNFPQPSNLAVTVQDPKSGQVLTDYRWIIEEDRSFYTDPGCTSNPPPATSTVTGLPCLKSGANGTVPELGTNFHTSDMTYVDQGCTGSVSCESGQYMIDPSTGNHVPAVCDVGNGVCRPDPNQAGNIPVLPGQAQLDPTKRYYISVLPGDAANPFIAANTGTNCASGQNGANDPSCGHSMGGASIAPGQTAVTVAVEQAPFPTAKLSVNVFEDDFPLNGEQDSGGGVDVLATNEPGLGSFNVILWDDMGGSGDVTGQMTYDMFNQPLSNSLDGTIDPVTGFNACPVTQQGNTSNPSGITGMITVCPNYESDGKTLSPLAGQAVVTNLMPGRFSVQAIPGADRIARGEEWLQTNTLDGQKAHDSFLRIGEPAYFQEFGPANYHVSIGFANPAIINGRLEAFATAPIPNLTAPNCKYTVTGKITDERMSRTPDERLYSSGSHDSFYWTQCYVSMGDPDGEDFAFTKCDPERQLHVTGMPQGRLARDRLRRMERHDRRRSFHARSAVGSSTQVCTGPKTSATVCDMGDIATNQWQANVYTQALHRSTNTTALPPVLRLNGASLDHVRSATATAALPTTSSRTSPARRTSTKTFPLFNWYVVETDTTRYKNTGTHTVYDAGGPADGSGLLRKRHQLSRSAEAPSSAT